MLVLWPNPELILCSSAPRMSATALYHPFSSSEMSLRRALWRTYVSTMCYNSTVRQLQNVLPNTGSLYAQWQRSQPGNPPVVSENISSGASLHWLGPKSNKKVMLYIAGQSLNQRHLSRH